MKCEDKEYCYSDCNLYEGNSIDINLEPNDCEIKADVTVGKANKTVRIWGRVTDCYANPVCGALIKLVKESCYCDEVKLVGVAHTESDCEGFYQFNVNPCEKGNAYKVIVSKAASGNERVISGGGNCKPCHKEHRIVRRCD